MNSVGTGTFDFTISSEQINKLQALLCDPENFSAHQMEEKVIE